MPSEIKNGLEVVAEHFDLSLSDVIVRFCRDGLKKFADVNPSFQSIYQELEKKSENNSLLLIKNR